MSHDATIIIFGAAVRPDGRPSRALQGRVEAALACAERLGGADFMPTGARGRHGAPEAEVMAALLRERGVPPARITLETTGRNTIRSVLACARALRGRGGAVYVATSAYHVPRCLLLLRLAGIRAVACPPPLLPASASRIKRWVWRLREIPAVPVDGAIMLWFVLAGRV